jgi:hypothetical protein
VSAPGINYDDVVGQFSMFVAPSARILVLGCANVKFMLRMYDDGYQNLSCMHPSERAVQHMTQQCGERDIKWLLHNPLGDNGIRDSQYDVIIDKGFLDTLKNKNVKLVEAWLQEMCRILAPRGQFLCFTFADEDVYFDLFNDYDLSWSSKCILIPIESDSFSMVVLFANQKSFGTLEEESTAERAAALQRARQAFSRQLESYTPLPCAVANADAIPEKMEQDGKPVQGRGAAANLYQPTVIRQAVLSRDKVSSMVALLRAVAQAHADNKISDAEYDLIKGALVKYHPNETDLAFVANQLSQAVALDCTHTARCTSTAARIRARYAGLSRGFVER